MIIITMLLALYTVLSFVIVVKFNNNTYIHVEILQKLLTI